MCCSILMIHIKYNIFSICISKIPNDQNQSHSQFAIYNKSQFELKNLNVSYIIFETIIHLTIQHFSVIRGHFGYFCFLIVSGVFPVHFKKDSFVKMFNNIFELSATYLTEINQSDGTCTLSICFI